MAEFSTSVGNSISALARAKAFALCADAVIMSAFLFGGLYMLYRLFREMVK